MTPADNHHASEADSPLSAEEPATPSRRELRQQRERRSKRNSWIIFFSVLIVVLAIVVFFVQQFSATDNQDDASEPAETMTRNPSPGLDGIIAANVSPENFLPGDCLANYSEAAEPAEIVECSTPHNAQLIGRRLYSSDMSYPGEEELREASETFCAEIPLLENTEATYSISTSRPSEYTWQAEEDRRIDCIVSTSDDTNFMESLVDEPVVDDQRSEQEQAAEPIITAEDALDGDAQGTENTVSPTATTATDEAS